MRRAARRPEGSTLSMLEGQEGGPEAAGGGCEGRGREGLTVGVQITQMQVVLHLYLHPAPGGF